MTYNKKLTDDVRIAGKYLNELLVLTRDFAKPGVTLLDIEKVAQDFIDKNKGIKGAFKGYQGFPANLCLSVNDCVVHGIPDNYILKDGDLLKIDAGIKYQTGIADSAVSLIIGGDSKNPVGAKLISATRLALDNGIRKISDGVSLRDFASEVSQVLKQHGFVAFKHLTGHGVGATLHEKPHVYNVLLPELKQQRFKAGMILAIEPITAEKSDEYIQKKGNDRNLYTRLGDLGAQREYTILVTEGKPEILAGITE